MEGPSINVKHSQQPDLSNAQIFMPKRTKTRSLEHSENNCSQYQAGAKASWSAAATGGLKTGQQS